LKNLSTRWAWVGSAVHGAIERLLRRLQQMGRGTDLAFEKAAEIEVEQEVEALTQGMRDQFRESRDGHYRTRPKKAFGLMEHEYADPVKGDEWKAMSAKAREALRSFFASDVYASRPATTSGSRSRRWEVRLRRHARLGRPRLRAPHPGGQRRDLRLEDRRRRPVGRSQPVCYALFVNAEHGVPPDRVTTRLVYLGPKIEVHDVRVGPDDIAEVSAAMRTSIAGMRAKLRDPAANSTHRDDFPMTTDLEKCRICSFRPLCRR
jgi:hypothetical protein